MWQRIQQIQGLRASDHSYGHLRPCFRRFRLAQDVLRQNALKGFVNDFVAGQCARCENRSWSSSAPTAARRGPASRGWSAKLLASQRVVREERVLGLLEALPCAHSQIGQRNARCLALPSACGARASGVSQAGCCSSSASATPTPSGCASTTPMCSSRSAQIDVWQLLLACSCSCKDAPPRMHALLAVRAYI